MALKIALEHPIEAHGEQITTLELREPTGEDVIKHGLPARVGSDESITMDGKATAAQIVALGGIPRSAVAKMAAGDFTACYLALLPFFFPSGAAAEDAETPSIS